MFGAIRLPVRSSGVHSSQNLKLLFCIKGLNNPGGGAERVLADVASGLAERGHKVAILTFDRPGGQPHYPLHASIERIELGLAPTNEASNLLITLRRMFASQNPDMFTVSSL